MIPVNRALLDLRGLALHSYYAGENTDSVRNSAGERVRSARLGVENFIKMYLMNILETFPPVNIIGVMEGENGNVRRRNMDINYKSKKSQDEDDEVVEREKLECFTAIQKLLLGLGCPLVKTRYCEADDTIALLVERLEGNKLIYTVDQDLLALRRVGVGVVVKGEFTEQFKGMDLNEAPPEMVTLYKSIVGDTSDYIKGVPGVGQKAWEKLVEAYGYEGMLELYRAIESGDYPLIESWVGDDKVLAKIHANRDAFRDSFMLAKLRPEWCEQSYAGKLVKPVWGKRLPSRERVFKVLESLDLQDYVESFSAYFPQFGLITEKNKSKLEVLTEGLKEANFIAFDYESFDTLKHPAYNEAKRSGNYVDVLNQKITGASFCYGGNFNKVDYITIEHRDTNNLPMSCLSDLFESLHENHSPEFVAHNATFESILTENNLGLSFEKLMDTIALSQYADENQEAGLKRLSKSLLNYDQASYGQIVPKGCDMRDISGEEVMAYGCDDSLVTAHLFILFRLITETEGTFRFCVENEPYFDKLLQIPFKTGIPIDWDRLEELSDEDDITYEEAFASLRGVLEEHCSEINEKGFKNLWVEVSDYELSKKKAQRDKFIKENEEGGLISGGNQHPIKSDEELAAEVEALIEPTYQACRYVGQKPKSMGADLKSITTVAKALGLPGIRSIKPDRLRIYVDGMSDQFKDTTPNEQQEKFVILLGQCIDDPEAFDELEIFIREINISDSSLWEGDQLNPGSPKQMAELFIGKMGLPIMIRNMVKEDGSTRDLFNLEGAPSTNEMAILTWIAEFPKDSWKVAALELVLTLKGITQRRSLYYKPYRLWRSPQDDRIHPQFRSCGTTSRRPSGNSPNILQVSKVKDSGKMRSCFLAQSDDEVIVSIDFSQQELFILGELSQDKNLLSCFVGEDKRDVHSMTGTEIMNMLSTGKRISYEDFVALLKEGDKEADKIRKKYAKTMNFLIVYGGSAAGLSRKAIVPKAMAEKFVAGFHKTYPKVEEYQERIIKEAKAHGFVSTPYGNRKHCSGLFVKDKAVVCGWERSAVNFTIQGTAADIAKQVAREYYEKEISERFSCTPYAFVYDEVVASVPRLSVVGYVQAMEDIMEVSLPSGLRLTTGVSIGLNWGEQIELGSRPSIESITKVLGDLECKTF